MLGYTGEAQMRKVAWGNLKKIFVTQLDLSYPVDLLSQFMQHLETSISTVLSKC